MKILTNLLAALALRAHLEGVEIVWPRPEVPCLEVLNALALSPGAPGVALTESLKRSDEISGTVSLTYPFTVGVEGAAVATRVGVVVVVVITPVVPVHPRVVHVHHLLVHVVPVVHAVHGHCPHGGEGGSSQEASRHPQAEGLAGVSFTVAARPSEAGAPVGAVARGPVPVLLPSVGVDPANAGPGSVPAGVLLRPVRVCLEGITAGRLGVYKSASTNTGPAAAHRARARAGSGRSPLLLGVAGRGSRGTAAPTPAEPPAS